MWKQSKPSHLDFGTLQSLSIYHMHICPFSLFYFVSIYSHCIYILKSHVVYTYTRKPTNTFTTRLYTLPKGSDVDHFTPHIYMYISFFILIYRERDQRAIENSTSMLCHKPRKRETQSQRYTVCLLSACKAIPLESTKLTYELAFDIICQSFNFQHPVSLDRINDQQYTYIININECP